MINMETNEALEVLKRMRDYYIKMWGDEDKNIQAYNIAIAVMENHYRISELILEKLEQFPDDKGLYTRGLYDGYYNSVNIINSIIKQP